MSEGPIVSDELALKFATEKDTPYERWVRSQGLDIKPAMYVRQLRTIELKPWAERGGRAVFLNHETTRTTNDAYVCEIPAGGIQTFALVPNGTGFSIRAGCIVCLTAGARAWSAVPTHRADHPGAGAHSRFRQNPPRGGLGRGSDRPARAVV